MAAAVDEDVVDIQRLTGAQLVAVARARLTRGHGAASAIYRAALRSGRFEPEEHGLSAAASTGWRDAFRLSLPETLRVKREQTPTGLTAKVVLGLHDGLECESVLLPMGRDKSTLCVSSQVGCKMGCTFCETGRMGLLRNLSTAEIVGQVLAARLALAANFRNIVFMGMGEALDNFEALAQALRVLTDPAGMALSQERITVCTVGSVDGIQKLAALGLKRLNLSVSLNAPTDGLRAQLMPIARRVRLTELQAALVAYQPRRNFVLGVNYCLMPGINDAREHAAGVARFCAPLARVMVNVIPYNPGSAPLTRPPTEDEIEDFVGWLRDEGLPVRRRVTKGRDVMAACGQLGNVELRRRARSLARV
jgi:23S rRNA (adenine2503-C2)-methyltransferase